MKFAEEIKALAAVHAALGDPVRLAIIGALRLSDRSPSFLGGLLELDSNLLAHHLQLLESVGLIRRNSSAGDRRRRYVTLNQEMLRDPFFIGPPTFRTVLFLCSQNSARSQLAAALGNARVPGSAESAGTHPAARVHPLAVAVAARHGMDLTGATPRSLASLSTTPDLIVTVCDRAAESLDLAATPQLHWSLPDPAETEDEAAFDQTFDALDHRITLLYGARAAH